MRNALTILALTAVAATSGCAMLKGRSRTPDEFAVARNAPLIIPPDFNLAPPVAGTVGLTPGEAQQVSPPKGALFRPRDAGAGRHHAGCRLHPQ